MNALRLLVVSLTLGSALLLRADLGQPSQSLTLEDCIDQSIAHNLNLRIARIGPIVAQNNLSLARAGYDPTFNFNAQHDFDRTGGGLDSDQRIIPPSESDSDSFSGGLGGLLPWGMTYDVTAAGAYVVSGGVAAISAQGIGDITAATGANFGFDYATAATGNTFTVTAASAVTSLT